jgi:hypothetical protein
MSTNDLPVSLINVRSNKELAMAMNLQFINLSPSFQREYEAWNEKLKTRFIESILLGRAMNPIWTVENSDDGSTEVLDGMHRLTTVLKFLNNEFPLGSSLCSLDVNAYKGKCFEVLSNEDKNKIRNYNFTFNHLDASYRNDCDKLMDMYEILNASSKPLNKHEFHKPMYKPFYDLISVNHARWFKTPIFEKEKITRGDLFTDLTKVLALSEERFPLSFSSINDIANKWEATNLGGSKASVEECIMVKGSLYNERLDKVKKYMDKFLQEGLFPCDDTVVTLILISRTVALIKKDAVFSRHISNLVTKFKSEIIDGSIQDKLGCTARNAMFQKKLINKVNDIIRTEIGETEELRFFTKAVIDAKLVEQNGICSLCNQSITKQQRYEGDHIHPWGQMGRTVPENCQVVHQKCHKRKC